jgi:hypothetical protein
MASQPLAFAELLAGGVLVTSSIQNKSLAQTLKGEAGTKLESQPSGGSGAGGGGSEAEVPLKNTAPTPGASVKKGANVSKIPGIEKEIEKYLGRALTPKERKEIVASEGNV